jgi:MFS family permease
MKAAILNLCTALVLCVLCEWLALYVFHTADNSNGWIWPMFGINFVFAWCIATIIGMIPSIPEKGVKWAMKHAKPSDGAKFGALVNIPINTVYALILCYLVGALDACVLGGAPFIASIFGFLQNIIPVWVACYIVTFLLQGPIENLARKACNDPAPAMPQTH